MKDIYVSFSDNQIEWTDPVNIGQHINTASNEMAPFLAPDGRTLFFSSNGLQLEQVIASGKNNMMELKTILDHHFAPGRTGPPLKIWVHSLILKDLKPIFHFPTLPITPISHQQAAIC